MSVGMPASSGEAGTSPTDGFRYAGFWIRVWASVIDLALSALWTNQQLIMGPADVLINWVLPSIAVIVFWQKKQATLGKIAIRARIVDARTGLAPSARQDVIRYFGYLLSVLPLGLGYLWVAFDRRKQGFHDKLAGTVVVRDLNA